MADYQDDDDIDEVDEQADEQSETDGEQSDEQTEQQADGEQNEEEQLQNNLNIKAEFAKTKKQFEAKSSFFPFLSEKQKISKNRAKQIEPEKVAAFDAEVKAKQGAFIGKVLSALPTIGIVLLCLIVIILLVAAVFAIVDFLFGWIDDLFGGNDAASNWVSGITGDYFYGARLIYRDQEQAGLDLQVDYIDAFSYVITDFKSDEITLSTTLPQAGYQLGDFDKNYPIANGAVIKIAEVMFVYDNPEAALPTNPALDELLHGIKYFGFDDENLDDIAAALAQYISADESLYSAPGDVDVENELAAQFEASLREKYTFQNDGGTDLPSRSEMLYVKDYVLADDEDAILENVENKDYVALIYFPRKNVQISFVTYQIYGSEKDDFDISMFLNGQQIATTSDFEFDEYLPKEKSEKPFNINNYKLTKNIALTAQNFNETYAEATSIYSILQQNANSSSLSVLTAEGGKEYLTFAQFGLTATMCNKNANPYMFRIYDIDYV